MNDWNWQAQFRRLKNKKVLLLLYWFQYKMTQILLILREPWLNSLSFLIYLTVDIIVIKMKKVLISCTSSTFKVLFSLYRHTNHTRDPIKRIHTQE